MNHVIVIGLGAGRTGTASLAKLVSAQKNALCFHEMNPSCVRHAGTPQPAINMVHEFDAILKGGPKNRLVVDLARGVAADAFDQLQGMDQVDLLGDIAHYHLSYVEDMIAQDLSIRFVCIYREKAAVVKSFLAKTKINRWPSKRLADWLSALITRTPYYDRSNHWMQHDGSQWLPDPIWDKVFPDFQASGPEEALGLYFDYYYKEAHRLADLYPALFRVFDLALLNSPDGQKTILDFCGIASEKQVPTKAHIHQVASR